MATHTTTSMLLSMVADSGNEAGWNEFDARYRPILVAFSRRLGLDDVDAADAAQETLARFLVAFREGKFDRGRGALRSWIIGIARNCVREQRDRRVRRRERRGLSALSDWPDDDGVSRVWDEECRRSILERAFQELRDETRTEPRTIRAFELLAVEERSVSDVARMLQMTRNDVYLAKHRCLSRLRTILGSLREAYEVG